MDVFYTPYSWPVSLLTFVAITIPTYLIFLSIYRLYFHPLAKFPGPKLPALTGWYEFYYECILGGRYFAEILRMHDQYGPIIRIGPDELHVNDPDWTEPFKISSRVSKWHWYYRAFGSSQASFGTVDHELHRIRRSPQNPYFTVAEVQKFEPEIEHIVGILCSRLEEAKEAGQPINFSNACKSLATDVVTEFAFHKSYNLLSDPEFAASNHSMTRTFAQVATWHRHFGFILQLFEAMPRWFVSLTNPSALAMLDFFDDIENQTKTLIAKHKGHASQDVAADIVQQMLDSDMPEQEKNTKHLMLEVRTIVAAGTETSGNTLSVTIFHLVANPDKAQRLKEELLAAQKRNNGLLPTYQELQQLPYLSAVVSEGLRISTSGAGRHPRINPRSAMNYKSWTIPANTPVSLTQKFIHENPEIFPSPRTFSPERWVNPADRKRLEKYLTPFGRGSRVCVGMNLANAEMYLALARIFASFDLSLYKTNREDDIDQYHDFVSPYPKAGSVGLRCYVK